MSSIAYITDRKMLEYHRVSGNTKMNFWRLKTNKKFLDFKEGDFLFFLAKKTERGKDKEKGLLGYGKLSNNNDLSISKMWSTYGNQNGSENIEELQRAIIKITKSKQVPKEMNCLLLEDVIFFQSPIYLSELGMKVSKNVESYIYLDHDGELTTSKIIQKAKLEGLDTWNMMIYGNQKADVLEKSEIDYIVGRAHQEVGDIIYEPNDQKKASKAIRRYHAANEDCLFIKNYKMALYQYCEGKLKIILPMIGSKKKDNKYKVIVGQMTMYREFIEAHYSYPIKIEGIFVNQNGETIKV